jgi:hypothetical protein
MAWEPLPGRLRVASLRPCSPTPSQISGLPSTIPHGPSCPAACLELDMVCSQVGSTGKQCVGGWGLPTPATSNPWKDWGAVWEGGVQ